VIYSAAQKTAVIRISYGNNFDEPKGIYTNILNIDPVSTQYVASPKNKKYIPRERYKEGTKAKRWQLLQQQADLEKFFALDERIPCPDCNDSLEEWIQVKTSAETHRVTFTSESVPEMLKKLHKTLREEEKRIRKAEEKFNCTLSGYAAYTPNSIATKKFESYKGLYPFPVDSFVSYTHCCEGAGEPEKKSTGNVLVGMDIVCKPGTHARAIAYGKVTRVMEINRNWVVIIQHGDYLSVYPGLSSVLVKPGDKISSKTKIGIIATSEYETILNFQLWKGAKAIDPAGWLYIQK
jgi:hypothetical protein